MRGVPAQDRLAIGALVIAAAVLTIGLVWDMSWDTSIGRDSFWSPPHLAVNAGGALAAAVALWWAVRATRGGDPSAVGWGPLRTPLGAAFVVWGGVAMLAAGASDLAWSNAYGMAFGAWTPPQVLFVLAVTAILAGVLLAASARSAGVAVACAGGLLVTFAAVATMPYSLPNLQHGSRFFLLSSAIYPLLLTWIARAGAPRHAATVSAAIYLAVVAVMVWVLPLFEARALVGPVLQKIDHMVPPRFPLLLIVPALIVDRVAGGAAPPAATRGRARRGDTTRAVLLGVAFTAAFVAVQWSFSAFLLSPASDNRFWAGGGRHWPFYVDIGEERREFWEPEGRLDVSTAAACVVVASLAARAGLWLGRWTRAVRR